MRSRRPAALRRAAYRRHAERLVASYHHWTGQHLVGAGIPANRLAGTLFDADCAIVSHGTENDPIFNFGNAVALRLFEASWEHFTRLPSRLSAGPEASPERASLLARVAQKGFVSGYRGIRVSTTGKRFVIADATVWLVLDSEGQTHGSAAMFSRWWPLA